MSWLDRLLRSPTDARHIADQDGWWPHHQGVDADSPFRRAALASAGTERLGLAFVSGYQAALEHIGPQLALPAALCATEATGGHPRSIQTRIDGDRVSGVKTFVTTGDRARTLLVFGVAGEADGRRDLRVIEVARDAPGVRLSSGLDMPFVPEVKHAVVTLVDAPGTVWPGDGFATVVRPFRTVEDIHVIGAVIASLLGIARRSGWNADPLVADLVTLDVLSSQDPASPAVHVALAGVQDRLQAPALPWDDVEPGLAKRWRRDLALLNVARGARERRRAKAWAALE